MDILKVLNWRYATKAMNGKKINPNDLDVILQAINLAPTSLGLQPFDIIVVSNDEMKNKILPIANNQQQIVKCSDLIIFAAWTEFTEERKATFYKNFEEVRGNIPDALRSYVENVYDNAKNNKEWFTNWAQKQAYIALGIALVAAADRGVDATPMEGFNPTMLDELLNLKEKKLTSTVLMPVGYRDVLNDYLVKLPKVRRKIDELVTKV